MVEWGRVGGPSSQLMNNRGAKYNAKRDVQRENGGDYDACQSLDDQSWSVHELASYVAYPLWSRKRVHFLFFFSSPLLNTFTFPCHLTLCFPCFSLSHCTSAKEHAWWRQALAMKTDHSERPHGWKRTSSAVKYLKRHVDNKYRWTPSLQLLQYGRLCWCMSVRGFSAVPLLPGDVDAFYRLHRPSLLVFTYFFSSWACHPLSTSTINALIIYFFFVFIYIYSSFVRFFFQHLSF